MKVKVSYQTLQLPPPLAFAYTLEMDFSEQEIAIQYDLEFLNRDEVTQEEIEEEGFTGKDDYSWKGTLGAAWVADLKDDLADAELEDESDDFNIYLHIEITEGEEQVSGLAVLAEEWDYRLQEVIQAIYEKAGVEDMLKLNLINKSGNTSEFYEVSASFEHQTALANKKPLTWEELHDLMSDVYTMSFDDEPLEKPNEDGLWIDPDGGTNYQLFDKQAGPKSNKIKQRILTKLKG